MLYKDKEDSRGQVAIHVQCVQRQRERLRSTDVFVSQIHKEKESTVHYKAGMFCHNMQCSEEVSVCVLDACAAAAPSLSIKAEHLYF